MPAQGQHGEHPKAVEISKEAYRWRRVASACQASYCAAVCTDWTNRSTGSLQIEGNCCNVSRRQEVIWHTRRHRRPHWPRLPAGGSANQNYFSRHIHPVSAMSQMRGSAGSATFRHSRKGAPRTRCLPGSTTSGAGTGG